MRDWFAELQSTGDPIGDVRRFLSARGRADTLRHASQVAAEGRRLAGRWAVPPGPAALACWSHDLAAVVPLGEVVAVAEALGDRLMPADRALPQIVHGRVAAAVLRSRLGIDDGDVLSAVRHHSTLRAGASALEQLVFIADKIALDPSAIHAGFQPALLAARETQPLPVLCRIYLDWAVREGPRLGWQLHPDLVAARRWLAGADRPAVAFCGASQIR